MLRAASRPIRDPILSKWGWSEIGRALRIRRRGRGKFCDIVGGNGETPISLVGESKMGHMAN